MQPALRFVFAASFLRNFPTVVLLLCGTAHAATPNTDTPLLRGAHGVVVTSSDVEAELSRMPDETRLSLINAPAQLQQLVNNLYLRRAAAAAVQKNGLADRADTKGKLLLARETTLGQAWVEDIVAKVKPTAEALETYAKGTYKVDSKRFEAPAQFKARQILIKCKTDESLRQAEALLAKLKAGASFEASSDSKTSGPGNITKTGDLGWFPAGQMGSAIDQAVAKLKPGELSPVVETDLGYHIILLDDLKPAKVRPYEEVREELYAEALAKLQGGARDTALTQLQSQAKGDDAALKAFIDAQQAARK